MKVRHQLITKPATKLSSELTRPHITACLRWPSLYRLGRALQQGVEEFQLVLSYILFLLSQALMNRIAFIQVHNKSITLLSNQRHE
jgi:hypothetical protein